MSTYYGWPPNSIVTGTTVTTYPSDSIQAGTITVGTISSSSTYTYAGGAVGAGGWYTYSGPISSVSMWPIQPTKVDLTQITSEELMDEVLRRGVFKSIKEYRAKKQTV
jgi:hypothetical protein